MGAILCMSDVQSYDRAVAAITRRLAGSDVPEPALTTRIGNVMAASLIIEVETGVFTGRIHPHDGYYAGDFSGRSVRRTSLGPTLRSEAAVAAEASNTPVSVLPDLAPDL